MTKKEKEERILELKSLIKEKEEILVLVKKDADKFNAMQLALKICLNQEYGALANKHFVCFCNAVAASITAHGRNLIQTMESSNEKYWYDLFHTDKDFHLDVLKFQKVLDYIDKNNLKRLDIITDDKERSADEKIKEILDKLDFSDVVVPEIEPIDGRYIRLDTKEYIKKPLKSEIYITGEVRRVEPVSAYCDTDSLFVSFKPALKRLNIAQKDKLDIVHYMSRTKMQDFFKENLDEYAKKYKVANDQDFEMEQISKSIIYLQKKMYIKNVVWEEGVYSEPETNLQAKGVDLVRSSSPTFIRNKENGVYKIIKYYFKNADKLNDRDLVKLIREMKELFKLADIEDISMTSGCNKYNEKVLDDKTSFKLLKGTHHAVKAAALHNYLLNQNPELKQKYSCINSGQKIKYYYTTNPLSNEFGYAGGSFPMEIANLHAPIDYDMQFQKCVLGLVNRFNRALGLSKMTPKLTFTVSLF